MNTNNISQQCLKMMNVNITGDIVPPLWKKYLKVPNRPAANSKTHKPERIDQDAISILSELVYWQTPTVVRNEQTGHIVEIRQKFKADKIQKSYQSLGDYHGFNKRRAKEALDRLTDQLFVTREFRTIKTGDLVLSNVMFLEVISEAVDYISNTIPNTNPSYAITREGVRHLDIGGTSLEDTYTEITTEITNSCSKEQQYVSKNRNIEKEILNSKDETLEVHHTKPGQNHTKNNPLNIADPARPEQNQTQSIGSPKSGRARPRSKQDKPLGSNSDAVVGKQDTIKPDAKNFAPTKSQLLRDSVKFRRPAKKKEQPVEECPEKLKPFMDIFEKNTGRKFRGVTVTSTKSWKAIRDMLNGNYYTEAKYPDLDPKYFDYEMTENEFEQMTKQFGTMRNNASFNPRNKKPLQNITPKTFFYNEEAPFMKSYFIFCLENSLQPLAKQLQDIDPEYTEIVIAQCQNRFGWDLSNGGRNSAIRCTQRLTQFFEDNRHNLSQYDYFYGTAQNQVKELLDMLESYDAKGLSAKEAYLYSDKTYNEFFPEYLKQDSQWIG